MSRGSLVSTGWSYMDAMRISVCQCIEPQFFRAQSRYTLSITSLLGFVHCYLLFMGTWYWYCFALADLLFAFLVTCYPFFTIEIIATGLMHQYLPLL